MKNYRVYFNAGDSIDLIGVEFDAELFTASLNDQKNNFVNLSGYIVNKHTILKMVPFTVEE